MMNESANRSASLLKGFIRDEAGFVVGSELILLSVVIVIGCIAGLSTLRTALVYEIADVATALGDIDQSFSIGQVTSSCGTMNASIFIDNTDFCTPGFNDDFPPSRLPSGCIGVTSASAE